jgi:methionyl-tRNA formyltransferase
MRIVFMGTPDFAIPSLRILVEHGYPVVGVVTAPDRPAGRGLQLRPSPVKEYALSQGLKVLQPEKLRDPDFQAELSALAPDLAVVVAFRMLPEAVWRMPRLGTFNLHASLLPDYRGAAPINWAVINGERRSGATTFFLDKAIDTGQILLQQPLDIPDDWSAGDLHDQLMVMGADLVLKTVQGIEAGDIQPYPQDETVIQHAAPKIFKEHCRIDWQQPADRVRNLIRGLSPFPTAWATLDGKVLKLYRVALSDAFAGAAGQVHIEGGRLWIACGAGAIEVQELQLEGKTRMDAATFLRGYKGGTGHVE